LYQHVVGKCQAAKGNKQRKKDRFFHDGYKI
jgi:hypothetical protein